MVYKKKICIVHETHIYFTEIKKTFAQSFNHSFSVLLLLRLVIRIKALGAEPHRTCHIRTESDAYTSGKPLAAGSA
jgi:hypothetical protein